MFGCLACHPQDVRLCGGGTLRALDLEHAGSLLFRPVSGGRTVENARRQIEPRMWQGADSGGNLAEGFEQDTPRHGMAHLAVNKANACSSPLEGWPMTGIGWQTGMHERVAEVA